MMIVFDDKKNYVAEIDENGNEIARHALTTPEAFELINRAWRRVSWDVKYIYAFSWMGRPLIQLPEDVLRIQEVIWEHQPDVFIETGVAHGGSLVFYSTLFKAMEKGRVIGVELELRPHNRKAIDAHILRPYITLVDGSSVDPDTVAEVKSHIKPGEKVMVMLDANHTKEHVLEELRAYGPMVSVGSYIVASDGIMEEVVGAPRTKPEWKDSNPQQAALAFVKENKNFVIEEPVWPFNEGVVRERLTYWPNAFIKRIS
jgi:cephalosporin hydroxylase